MHPKGPPHYGGIDFRSVFYLLSNKELTKEEQQAALEAAKATRKENKETVYDCDTGKVLNEDKKKPQKKQPVVVQHQEEPEVEEKTLIAAKRFLRINHVSAPGMQRMEFYFFNRKCGFWLCKMPNKLYASFFRHLRSGQTRQRGYEIKL